MSSNFLEKIFSTNIASVLVFKQFLFNKKIKINFFDSLII